MSKDVLIFIPNSLSTNKLGFIEGFYKNYGHLEAYYITSDKIKDQCKDIIGYCGQFVTPNFINENKIYIKCGKSDVEFMNQDEKKVTQLFYDFNSFKYSNIPISEEKYGVHVKQLTENIRKCSNKNFSDYCNRTTLKPFDNFIYIINLLALIFSKIESIVAHSALLSHCSSSLKNMTDLLKTYKKEKCLSPKLGNIIFAKCIDITLGIVFIYFCFKYEAYFINKFEIVTQEFVGYLRNLLIYLMGSPVGLKLNYAFNHSLARFFFYHINLWRVFLQAMQPQFETYFHLLVLPGFFGISYQFSLFCDIISIATFHIYCIYVYAVRLFYLQIRGLDSLWRLFIGRKFNPLRNRIDSHEYSPNQLFIGTLGFTVLLFLLPTTTLYYAVFLTFRLMAVIIQDLLVKCKNFLSNLPIYAIILWAFQCPTIAGNIVIEYKPLTNKKQAQVHLKLVPFSLMECIRQVGSNSGTTEESNLIQIVYNVCTGKLI